MDGIPDVTRDEYNSMTEAEKSELAQLRAENAQLKAKAAKAATQRLTLKVGDKGGVSLYGLNARFPVTLYEDQWARLFAFVDDIKSFILENKHRLASKPTRA